MLVLSGFDVKKILEKSISIHIHTDVRIHTSKGKQFSPKTQKTHTIINVYECVRVTTTIIFVYVCFCVFFDVRGNNTQRQSDQKQNAFNEKDTLSQRLRQCCMYVLSVILRSIFP